MTALSAAAGAEITGGLGSSSEDDDAPWRDQSLPLSERMKLSADRPVGVRMMAAMAQQDCGQCGYNCRDYASAISMQAEDRLNLCVPGGKETARMLKSLVEDMGGGATDPDEAKAKLEARSVAQAALADDRPGRSRARPVLARILKRYRLNQEGSAKQTFHVEFDLSASGLTYRPGDSFGVFPKNDPSLADRVISAIGAPPDFPIAGGTLRDVLVSDMSLGTAPDGLFDFIGYLTGGARRQKAKALAKGEDPDGDLDTLDVLAALEKFPGIRPDPEAFIECLEPLQPRLYSISSSQRERAEIVSLTVDQVQYTVGGRTRFGVASTLLGERLDIGDELKVYVQQVHNFSLPSNGNVPVIMVGPGTGIAPFRSFLQERRCVCATGGAWLFYGHQHAASDFFYRDELEGLQADGALTRLSLAWSRDGSQKVYVQDRMLEASEELWKWLEKGAHFYVCGDAKKMAADVEKALLVVVQNCGGHSIDGAKAFVQQLKRAGRYQTDVY